MIIGIDLGTTHSAVAYLTADGPQLIANALGDRLTPSIVGIDNDGQVLVGRAAQELQVVAPDRCAALFKRLMGSDEVIRLAKRKMSATELSSLVLRSLKQDAEAALGQPVEQAVITVPAYFNEHQRKATIEAGKIAGLDVKRILNEPTAAAIAYGLHASDKDRVLLIFDLGGGTFDVSIVDVFDGAIEVRASSGESFLGGEDFTVALASQLLADRGVALEHAELKAPRQVARLLAQCESAKRRLSTEETATVRIPDKKGELGDAAPRVEVAREDFARWTEKILARVEPPIRRALGDARLNRSDIDDVILVGGATRMPSVVARVTELFEKRPRCRLNPDEVVAQGAAVQAGLFARAESIDDLVVTDVAPFTLGVEISKEIGAELRDGYFLPVINRNTTIPVSRVRRVTTLHANQQSVRVGIYQGEARMVEQNLMLGEFFVEGIPLGPAGQEIDIRLTYDLNGVLEVEATVVKTGSKITHIVTKHAKGMTPSQIESAVSQMQELKHHPRDDAENRFLLRRADRIFTELSLDDRETLSGMIDGFEDVLELGDKDAIAEYRAALNTLLDRFESHDSGEWFDQDTDEQW